MIRGFFPIFSSALSLLYLIGSVHILLSFKRSKNILALLRSVLIVIFLFPFLLYFLAGLINVTFGWARNFFYLLPIYLLIIFYCLKTMLSNKGYYYLLSAIILSFLLWGGIINSLSWETVNLEREKVRCAAKIDSDLVIVSYDRGETWPFAYYAEKYGVRNKVLYLHNSTIKKKDFSIFDKLPNAEKVVIVEGLKNQLFIKKGSYHLGKDSFEIVKVERYRAEVGPYQLIKNLAGHSSPYIVVYFCKKR